MSWGRFWKLFSFQFLDETIQVSDYVYLPLGAQSFCSPRHFVWRRNVTVHVIVPGNETDEFLLSVVCHCWSRHDLGQSLYDGEDSGMVTIHCHRLDQALHRTMEILISNIWKDLCTVCQHKIVMIEKFVEFPDHDVIVDA